MPKQLQQSPNVPTAEQENNVVSVATHSFCKRLVQSRLSMRVFEVCVYNRAVQVALKNNEDHAHYNERWCDSQHMIILARDEIELGDKLRGLYPADLGFVIEDVIERHITSNP